jgi:hypothetical protein
MRTFQYSQETNSTTFKLSLVLSYGLQDYIFQYMFLYMYSFKPQDLLPAHSSVSGLTEFFSTANVNQY